MSMIDAMSFIFITTGCGFFLAGTVGLLRFPDVYTRLHALTKADNMGLGLIVVGLIVQSTPWLILKMLFIWLLILIASASACYLVARTAIKLGVAPWKKR